MASARLTCSPLLLLLLVGQAVPAPQKAGVAGLLRPGPRPVAKYCPYCDSSVYSYCSDKLLHDACCCLDPFDLPLPRECRVADCSFLHANTCQEHSLITACCCTNLL